MSIELSLWSAVSAEESWERSSQASEGILSAAVKMGLAPAWGKLVGRVAEISRSGFWRAYRLHPRYV